MSEEEEVALLKDKIMCVLEPNYSPVLALTALTQCLVSGFVVFNIDKKVFVNFISDCFDDLLIIKMKMEAENE